MKLKDENKLTKTNLQMESWSRLRAATAIISVFVMAIAKPPIPCGGIICIAYLFTVVGVPAEAISVILCIDPLAAMFNGVCNESANITTSFIVARGAGMLDEKKYFAS